jgi:transcriptional regulator with XRE-family HTH domain
MTSLEKILPRDRLRTPHPLKARIRSLKLRQTDLAAALDCSEPELSRWLNNRRAMPRNVEERLHEWINALEEDDQNV